MSKLELMCGDRVEVKAGEFKGSVGIVRGIKEIKKTAVQVVFIGGKKTLPIELLEKTGSNNQEVTEYVNNSENAEFSEAQE